MVGGVDPLVDEVGSDPGDTECQRHRTRHGLPQQQREDSESDEEHGTPREDADAVDEVFLPGVMGQVSPTAEIPSRATWNHRWKAYSENVQPTAPTMAPTAGPATDIIGPVQRLALPGGHRQAALRSLRRARSTIARVSVRSGRLSMSGLGGAGLLDEENPHVGTGQLGPRVAEIRPRPAPGPSMEKRPWHRPSSRSDAENVIRDYGNHLIDDVTYRRRLIMSVRTDLSPSSDSFLKLPSALTETTVVSQPVLSVNRCCQSTGVVSQPVLSVNRCCQSTGSWNS